MTVAEPVLRLGFVASPIDEGLRNHASFDYFASLTALVVAELQNDFDVVINVPRGSLSAAPDVQAEHLLRIASRQPGYYGGVVVAGIDPARLRSAVRQLLAHGVPVFTIDMPWVTSPVGTEAVEDVISVYPDNVAGGREAAKALWDYAGGLQLAIKDRHFVVLSAGRASAARVEGFCAEIGVRSQREDLVRVVKVPEFDRRSGEDAIDDLLAHGEDFAGIAGIFCCNDEIALGARSALMRRFPEKGVGPATAIVGFDGIRDVRVLIDDPHERWMLNSVEIPIGEMAKALKRSISGLLREHKPGERPSPVACGLLKPLNPPRDVRAKSVTPRATARGGVTLVAVLHGLGSGDPAFWGTTIDELARDARLRDNRIRPRLIRYETTRRPDGVISRAFRLVRGSSGALQNLELLGESVRTQVDGAMRDMAADRVLLLGHSLGGLVCASALGQWFAAQQPSRRPRVLGLGTVASPLGGAKLAGTVANLTRFYGRNVQIDDLAVDSDRRRRVIGDFYQYYLQGANGEWTPFRASSEEVLDAEQSELWPGEFDVSQWRERAKVLQGTHSGCIQDLGRGNQNYEIIVNWILTRAAASS